MKIVHQLLPTKSLLHKRQQELTSECLRCGHKHETYLHVFTCPCSQNRQQHQSSLTILQSQLSKLNTNPLIVQAITAILSAVHQSKPPTCPTPPFYKRRHHSILKTVFLQQVNLGPSSLLRGLVVRNWAILQNLHEHKSPDDPNIKWFHRLLHAIWEYSYSMWIGRCKYVNNTTTDDPTSLTHNEQLAIIRQFLRIPRNKLSTQEKHLHRNISRGMKAAHTTTLTHWIHLLKEVRAQSIRRKANSKPSKRGLQLITKFFRKATRK